METLKTSVQGIWTTEKTSLFKNVITGILITSLILWLKPTQPKEKAISHPIDPQKTEKLKTSREIWATYTL